MTPVRLFMQTSWGWPATESVHFIGLTLLFGSIAVWDLRLLGLGRGVPISAFHRLVPFAVAGFAINVVTGSMFVMAEANQYVYNRAFQFKLLFLALGRAERPDLLCDDVSPRRDIGCWSRTATA